jgi:methylenetetrahydrofolate reductase (NADPH)
MADPLSPDAAALRARLIGEASLEVTVRDKDAASVLGATLPRGARVHVTYLPSGDYRETVAQAKALALSGLTPIPHIAARALASSAELVDYAARLVGEAGATRVLIIGGDLTLPRGPFAGALDVLKTGVLETSGMREASFAAYPEAHPGIAAEILEEALAKKIAYAAQHGLESEIISQFCFEAAPVLDCIRRLRLRGVATPVRIGAAAPADALRMMKFALRCGVGASVRALEKQAGRLGGVLTTSGPEALVDALADGLCGEDVGAVRGMHFFVFGGVRQTATWLQHWRTALAAAG